MTAGLRVWIFRSNLGDCTNGGVTATAEQAILFGIPGGNVEREDVKPGDVVLRVRVRTMFDGHEYVYAEPVRSDGLIGAAGGNFVYSSDSRFHRVCDYPISVHDRFETTREND